MSRNLSSQQQTAISGGHRQIVPLVELDFDSGTLYFALGPFNIVVGAVTYLHTGALAYVKPATEAAGSVEGLEIGMSGLDPAIIAIATAEPYRGRIAKLLKAILDPATNAIVGNPVMWFAGRMQNMVITETSREEGGGAGTATVAIVAEHYDVQLSRAAPLRWSDADQQRLYPGDLGCQYATETTEKTVIFPSKESQM